ncbi:MAG: hypothetical protein IJ600_05400, partial [Lachnospiraceae bacterium]|nr:hypothetical protein [Lachnospiraceae bacterium]
QGSGFGQTAQSGSFGSAPQGSGFGQTAQSGSFGQAPQNSGFGSAPQGGGFGSTPQQTAAPKKKGNGGLIAAIIGIIVVLLGAGVAVAGFALGWFGGKKTIELSEKKLSIEVGEEATVEIKNYEDDLTKVTLEYSTEDKKIAEIASEYDDAFVVKGVSEGKTTVTVSGKNCEPVSITVKVSEAAKAEPTEAPKATEAPAATEKPEPTAQPTQAASSNYTTIKEAYGDDEFKIYLPDGFSFDYEEEDSAVMSDRSGNTIYVYSEMPGAPYYYLHPEEMEDDAEYDFSEFQFESVKIGTAPNGNDLYAAYRYDPNDEYGDYEVYYIYFAYEDWYGTEDYIVVEFSADYAEDDEAWFVEMAETIFGQ